jgi:hypothetical protein
MRNDARIDDVMSFLSLSLVSRCPVQVVQRAAAELIKPAARAKSAARRHDEQHRQGDSVR